ncbi:hypothetical protein [Bosea sp. (in: a-proteobacteria)]|jgi:hypothetical protein|uniref:hypothetical protein n=1 Tax=Bosea sp. (in: a-proteobacteria) TaxID=1871050 RepID=UPI001AC4CDBB|nr:hypothetical protein [Bosea sp. (in: a-proteobacteria)]MBN9436934.1 hypothetical protein [Bosea sp. (in: a-proteobacteria)]
MTRYLVGACASLLLAVSPVFAQAEPTAQERAACRSDAVKLCASFVGKSEQMNACLRDNKAKLSENCRKVVEARGG